MEVTAADYRVPLYRMLASDTRLDFTAIYASTAGFKPTDIGYGQRVAWDIDLLSGYRHLFVKNAETNNVANGALSIWDADIVGEVWKGKFDVLWVHGYIHPTLQLAILAQLATGRGLLFREEQTVLERRPAWKTALKQIWLRPLLARAQGLYIGQENREWLMRLGFSDDRLFHVPYCADNSYFRRESKRLAPAKAAIRKRFGLPEDDTVVFLTASRLIEKKQPGFLLEAYRRARAQTRCALLIVGSGELQGQLMEQVRRDGIPDVTFAGFMNRSEIGEAFAAADAFVLASRHDETWGIVVNEAMNFGLPIVVSTKVGCARDLVHPGLNGFIVSATDPTQLSAAMVELVHSPVQRLDMGIRSLEIVRNWDHEVAADGALRAIEAAVGAKLWGLANQS